jgi:signal transduction histidine kinase
MSSAFTGLAVPRLERTHDGRALGGVCAGIGRGLGVDPTLVRLTFALLSLASGAGLVAYAGAWLLLPEEAGSPAPAQRRRLLGGVLLVLSAVLALRGLGLADSVVWPAALCAGGILLARGRARRSAVATLGILLVGLGVILFVDRSIDDGARGTLFEPGGVAIALLLILGPWAWRLAVERDSERTVRIRAEERAEMAARVHDSVLQTLALVQREAEDPRRVASLARRQERELRAWLYPGARTAGASLGAALEAAAAEVEELHGVPVELVRTGDTPLDERVEALVLASREAMANAARHSGATEVAAFVDVGDTEIAVYVRDRGAGFDPANATRTHGIAESIRGRMARAGGSAEIVAAPGEGTEVELRLPVAP